MALVVITRKAYGDEPITDYPNLAGKAKNRDSYQGIALQAAKKLECARFRGRAALSGPLKQMESTRALAPVVVCGVPTDVFRSLFSDAVSSDESMSALGSCRA